MSRRNAARGGTPDAANPKTARRARPPVVGEELSDQLHGKAQAGTLGQFLVSAAAGVGSPLGLPVLCGVGRTVRGPVPCGLGSPLGLPVAWGIGSPLGLPVACGAGDGCGMWAADVPGSAAVAQNAVTLLLSPTAAASLLNATARCAAVPCALACAQAVHRPWTGPLAVAEPVGDRVRAG